MSVLSKEAIYSLKNINDIIKGDDFIDAHAWVADCSGNVIYDPNFEEYDIIKQINECSDTKVYKPFNFSIEDENKIYKCWDIEKKYEMLERLPFKFPVQFGNCIYNALSYIIQSKKKNKNKKIYLVIGSFGWKKKNGEPWYEFG